MVGLSQTLGERIGVTFQQMQKYEKGTNRIGSRNLGVHTSHARLDEKFSGDRSTPFRAMSR
jgi:hypothetical protein